MHKATLFFLLLLIFQSSFSQGPNTPIPISEKVKIGVLDNGLTYYLRENPKPENKVEIRLVVNVGSVLEDERQLGLAHFLEHMAFNGTKSFKKNDIVSFLQSIGVEFGADLNAYTSFDETVYILPIPLEKPENLDNGFKIIKEMGFDMLLDESEIDNERGVVLEERRTRLGPNSRISEKALKYELFGSQYVDRLPIGKKEILENFTYDDLIRFYKDWYRPDLMALIAVGDVDVETLEKKVIKYFNDIPKAKNPRVRTVFNVPNHDDTKVLVATEKEAQTTRVSITYKDRENAKPVKTLLDYRDNIIDRLFSNLMSDRLGELSSSENPPFISAFSGYGSTVRTKNAYSSTALTTPEKALTSLNSLLVENERVKKYGFLESELSRAKKNLLKRYESSYNERDKLTSGRIVFEYVNNFLEQEPIPGIEWEYKFLQFVLPSITLAEVNNRINKFVHDDNMVVTLAGVQNKFTENIDEVQIRNLITDVKNISIEAYAEEDIKENLIEKLPTGSKITSKNYIETIDSYELILENGIKVFYKKTDYQNDNILVRAISPGGTSLYNDKDFLSTSLATGFLSEAGFGGLTTSDMEKFMSGKTASFNTSVGPYSDNGSGRSSVEDLETMFELIYLNFTSLNFNPVLFNAFVNNYKSFYLNLLSRPQTYFQIKVGEKRNIGNARYIGFPTEKDFENINYPLAYKLRNDRFSDANDFIFFFVGNFDFEKLEKLIEKYLGALPTLSSSENYIIPEFRTKDEYEKFEVKKGKEPKSYVTFNWQEETEYSSSIATNINLLGEILSNNLIKKLREEESGVYGVGARGSMNKIPFGNVSFNISFPCGPENVDSLVNWTLEQIQNIKDGNVSEEDLNKVKEASLINFKENIKRNGYWMNYLINSIQLDLEWDRFSNYENKIKEVKTEDIIETAKIYLDDSYFLAILNPED